MLRDFMNLCAAPIADISINLCYDNVNPQMEESIESMVDK